MDELYLLQLSRFKVSGICTCKDKLLNLSPSTVLQLSFWCELVAIAKIKEDDVPENAVFYLHDYSYENLISGLPENEKVKINFKIELVAHIIGMSGNLNIGLVRELEQCLMIANTETGHSLNLMKQYLWSRTSFFSEHSLNTISEWLLCQVKPARSLSDLDDISLVSIIANRISAFNFEDELLEKFIVKNSKASVCFGLKEYLVKSRNCRLIQFLFCVSQKLGIQEQLFHGSINNQLQSQIFYQVFFKAKNSKKLHLYRNLESFMIKNSAVQGLVLHGALFEGSNNTSNVHTVSIPELIKRKDRKIFYKIKRSPFTTICQIVRHFLKLSKFKIPKQNNTLSLRQSFDLSPLFFMAIQKDYWEDQFYSSLLNLCLWVITDHWLIQSQDIIHVKTDYEDYRKNLCLGLVYFMMGYSLGTFVYYYPIQNNLLGDLFSLPSFASLALGNPKFLEIPWFIYVVNSELKTIMRQQNGYELAYKILISKSSSFESHFGSYLLNTIEMDLQRPKAPTWDKDKKYILKILCEYCNGKVYIEKAQNLRRQVETRT